MSVSGCVDRILFGGDDATSVAQTNLRTAMTNHPPGPRGCRLREGGRNGRGHLKRLISVKNCLHARHFPPVATFMAHPRQYALQPHGTGWYSASLAPHATQASLAWGPGTAFGGPPSSLSGAMS